MLSRAIFALTAIIFFTGIGASIARADQFGSSKWQQNFIGGIQLTVAPRSAAATETPPGRPKPAVATAAGDGPKLILAAARKSTAAPKTRPKAKSKSTAKHAKSKAQTASAKPASGKSSLNTKDAPSAKTDQSTEKAEKAAPDGLSARRAQFLPVAGRIKPAGLPLALIDAVITRESRYNPKARGSRGEVGLMQLLPSTARGIAREKGLAAANLSGAALIKWLEVPENNIRLGTHYLSMCHEKAKQNVAATIGCYNAGPGNMWSWKSIGYTRRYVRFVNDHIASN
ncbi:transglycosylase SLT domain-containing protein [Rhodoligotrophos defluvii]|uniref:transglycosylase SLT domain-containing protein n=1 Tax=Rhodoligotrophos defluvii TaxID=2561934 RepID=UPI0010C9C3C6|nr:transglycosylase SLT domain-containing protein [Rhodoligotrophos defluvii]